MKFLLSIFVLALFSINSIYSQTNDILNYYDTIVAGVDKFDKEKYDAAIEDFLKVPESDSNYVTAVTELMYTYYRQEKYDAAVEIGTKILYGGYDIEPNFVLNLGSSLDKLEKYDEAIKVYNIALKRFPLNHLIYYNIGYSNSQLEKYDDAIGAYRTSIEINPIYAKAHYQLALLALNEGKTTIGIMALNTYLMINPSESGSNSVLSLLNSVCSSKYKEDAEAKGVNIELGEDYSEIDLLVENYLALDKKYKVKSKIQLPFVKQSYLVFEKLSEMPASDGFWYRTYVPIFKSIYESGNFETYSYYISQSSESDKHQKIISKNKSNITTFISWLFKKTDDAHRKYNLDFPKSEYKDFVVYRGNSGFAVSFIGHENKEGNYQGYSERYHANGALQSTVFYNDNGKQEGEKISYHSNGRLKERGYFKDGVLQDSLISYSKFGRQSIYYTVVDDALKGKLIYYTNSGALSTELTVIDGEQQGDKFSYYEIGSLYSKKTMLDSKAQGRYISYYNTGEIQEVANYKDNLLEGLDTSFFRNGAIQAIVNFKEGDYNGKYVSYHDNGKEKNVGEYLEGKIIGNYKEYNYDGALESESNYDETGKKNGVYREFYKDGKPFHELDYKKGDVVGYRYFDTEGGIMKEAKRKKGTFDFEGYHKNGLVSSAGEYGKKYHQGVWKYYNQYGVMYKTNTYKDGDLEGETVNYYANGDVRSVEIFKEDKDYGYFYKNDVFKQKIREGFLLDGEYIGLWKEYYTSGILKETTFYLHDKIDGYNYEYAPNGNLYKRMKYEEGVIVAQWFYDEKGELTDSIVFENGCGKVESHFRNSQQVKEKYSLKNNSIHGDYFSYYPNGKKDVEGAYFAGRRNGTWKYYFINGKVSTEGKYEFGDKVGVWKTYYKNGTLKSEKEYRDGSLNGKWIIYFDNGKKELERIYKDNSIEGEAKYYSYTGVYDHSRFYTDGYLYAYEYSTTTGPKRTKIEKGTVNLKAHFKNGKVSREFTYENGWFQGVYNEYYPSGQLHDVCNFINDEYDGEYKTYYPNGKIKRLRLYEKGEQEGVSTEYSTSGTVLKTASYKQGFLDGPTMIYDKYGKLKHHYIYYYNDLVEIIK